jgi:hypothetical protein
MAAGWCVDWTAYDLDAIWEMVAGEGDQTTERQIHAWRRMADLCNHHADRITHAAEVLAHRWPPERSAAAEVFRDYANGLVASMREAAVAAKANAAELDRFGEHLAATRDRVRALKEQQSALARTEVDRAEYLRKLPPRAVIAPSALAGAPQVPAGWRDTLNAEAQQLMRAADPVIAETNARLSAPLYFDPTIYVDQAEVFNLPDTSGTGSAPTTQGRGVPAPTFQPPPAIPGATPLLPPAANTGIAPVLDGHTALGQSNAVPSTSAVAGSPASPPTDTAPVVRPMPARSPLRSDAVRLPSPSSNHTVDQIGRSPGRAVGSESATHAAAVPKSAPAGMVSIGGPLASGAVAAGAGRTMVGPVGPALGRGHRRGVADPSDPWSVAEGGRGILEPDPEPIHDPGPGVIGIDR